MADGPAVAAHCAGMRERHGSPSSRATDARRPGLEIAAVWGDWRVVGTTRCCGSTPTWRGARYRAVHPARDRALQRPHHEDPVATFRDGEAAPAQPHPLLHPHPDSAPPCAWACPTARAQLRVLAASRTREFIAACEAMGVGFWCYSGEVGSAAYLHVVAAPPWIHAPSQSLFRWQIDDVIEEGPFRPRRNVLPVPEGHGLGVTLSARALRRCHERFLREGPYNHYHDPKAPGKFRRLPLD